MRSNSALTYETEDMRIAVDELMRALNGFQLDQNSLGILYCNPEADVDLLLSLLKEKLPFDVVGSLACAVLDNKTGMNEFSTNLLILTGDDCSFDVFVSEPIGGDTIKERIGDVCKKVNHMEETKLILCFVPFMTEIILDDYPDTFHQCTGGKPVFGGASCLTDDGLTGSIYNDRLFRDCFTTVFVKGNVRPVFSECGNITSSVRKMRTVTKSQDNVVYTIDDMTLVEYLRSVGIITNFPTEYEMDFLLASVTLNILIEDGKENDPKGIYRSIFKLNFDDGSGVALGRIPIGSKICAVTYHRDDVKLSAHECLTNLLANIEDGDDYAYSTILCGSCNGRYMFMFPTKDAEGDIIMEHTPQNLTLAGYYTYGEICPTALHNGVAVNRSHNATLVMCAI